MSVMKFTGFSSLACFFFHTFNTSPITIETDSLDYPIKFKGVAAVEF